MTIHSVRVGALLGPGRPISAQWLDIAPSTTLPNAMTGSVGHPLRLFCMRG